MAETTISPNMNLPIPNVGEAAGPNWAEDYNECLTQIDAHTHSAGEGVPITPDAIDINADLPMNGYDLTDADAVTFQARVSALTSLLKSLQVVSADLYFIDGNGNSVRITQSGSVTGSSGTITGLPSGTASASFSGGTFLWQSATNTPATMDSGPLIIRSTTASSNGVTLSARSTQPSNYNIFWPLAAPAANQLPISDASGNLSWTLGLMPIGSVIATFPNLSGAYTTSATTTADAYGFVKCNGQTISDATSPMDGAVVPNINNSVFLAGSTTAGTTGGSATASGVGAHTHTFTSSTSVATSSHTHLFYHTHQWSYRSLSNLILYSLDSSDPTKNSIGTADYTALASGVQTTSGGLVNPLYIPTSNQSLYTAGVATGAPSGSGSTAATDVPSAATTVSGTTASSGSSFSILPPYITAVYLMRVK